MKLTLSQARSAVARVLSLSPSDARVADYINEAQERLLHKGKWPGTYGRFTIRCMDGCITWPRQLEAIDAVAINDSPGLVRNGWFEFHENGPGLLSHDSEVGAQLLDRGEVCSFRDIGGTPKRLRLYADVAQDNGVKVLLQGFNTDGQWVRTQEAGQWIDGVNVTLVNAGGVNYVDTAIAFSAITGVQKPVTQGAVRLYQLDSPGIGEQKLMAVYENDETLPTYRRSLVPGLPADRETAVTVVAKLRFIPARLDSDWLIIPSLPAIKEMCMAIRKAENNLPAEAQAYEARAVQLLMEYLMHWLGDGVVSTPRFANASTFGGGSVVNLT